ncbi:MAG: fibrillarin-like rRNA/tRNA 2'-O-methyltransferase [Candidatus Thermoplasmatota archaeon]
METYRFEGLYKDSKKLYTKNLCKGDVYGEEIFEFRGEEYRCWEPRRSKLAEFLNMNCKNFPFRSNSNVLYLGAGSGTTASHISDILIKGKLFCVELSTQPFAKLLELSSKRKNIFPILSNARFPEKYMAIVGSADVIYQDVAQRDQDNIFIKNAEIFLKKNGFGLLMVKARSIDVNIEPKEAYKRVKNCLSSKFKILECIELKPYEKAHACIVVTWL